MMRQFLIASLTIAFLAAFACAAPDAKPRKIYVVVFDFQCKDNPALGKQLADSVRLYMGGHKDEYAVLDVLTTQQASDALPAATDPNAVSALVEKIAAHVGLYGTVVKDGDRVTAEVKLIDRLDPNAGWAKSFSDTGERARGLIARQIVEHLLTRSEWVPPQAGDRPEPKDFAPPLNANGDFEGGLAGWSIPDRVSSFIEDGPAGRGKVLRIKTDLQRDPWLEYTRKLRFGQADPNNPPKIGRDVSYTSLAGMEGVFYVSDWIKATPGQQYWLTADMKGRTEGIFFPKIYVKGFLDWSAKADTLPETSLMELKLTPKAFAALPAEKQKALIAEDVKNHSQRYRREVFRWYLACRNEQDQWKHYADPCPPRGGLPANVEWLQIHIYAYWPPGEYLFDNVHLYADPSQKSPASEEPARTPK